MLNCIISSNWVNISFMIYGLNFPARGSTFIKQFSFHLLNVCLVTRGLRTVEINLMKNAYTTLSIYVVKICYIHAYVH